MGKVAPAFAHDANDGAYRLVEDGHGGLPMVLIDGANVTTPAAVVIPLDGDFAMRADAALRLWRLVTGRLQRRPPDRLTQQRRSRLGLSLRALDGRLAGESYRGLAQSLFGRARIPAGVAWKTHELRDRTIRLARTGLELMHGGYLDLLRHPRAQPE